MGTGFHIIPKNTTSPPVRLFMIKRYKIRLQLFVLRAIPCAGRLVIMGAVESLFLQLFDIQGL